MEYKMYETMVYVEFEDTTNITHLSQIIRGLQYVAVVSNKTDKDDPNPRGLLGVKAVSTMTAEETFEAIKSSAKKGIPEIKKFKWSQKRMNQIENF